MKELVSWADSCLVMMSYGVHARTSEHWIMLRKLIMNSIPSHCLDGDPQGVCPCTDTGPCAAK